MYKPIARPAPANRHQLGQQIDSEPRPRHRYLNYLNGGLSILVLFSAAALKEQEGVHDGFWLLCTLPARKSIKILALTFDIETIFQLSFWLSSLDGRICAA